LGKDRAKHRQYHFLNIQRQTAFEPQIEFLKLHLLSDGTETNAAKSQGYAAMRI